MTRCWIAVKGLNVLATRASHQANASGKRRWHVSNIPRCDHQSRALVPGLSVTTHLHVEWVYWEPYKHFKQCRIILNVGKRPTNSDSNTQVECWNWPFQTALCRWHLKICQARLVSLRNHNGEQHQHQHQQQQQQKKKNKTKKQQRQRQDFHHKNENRKISKIIQKLPTCICKGGGGCTYKHQRYPKVPKRS